MKEWANTLILCTVTGAALKTLLPGGERSPLYSSLKFLLSLILLGVVFSPILTVFTGSEVNFKTNLSLPESTYDTAAAKEYLFEKSTDGILNAAKLAFPEENFSLTFTSNEERIPTGILVECEDREKGEEICLFLRENFSILATLKRKE